MSIKEQELIKLCKDLIGTLSLYSIEESDSKIKNQVFCLLKKYRKKLEYIEKEPT